MKKAATQASGAKKPKNAEENEKRLVAMFEKRMAQQEHRFMGLLEKVVESNEAL